MAWFKMPEHKHHWVATAVNSIRADEKKFAVASITTYQCFMCGSIRYDKVDADGLVWSTITDGNGITIKQK